MHLTRRDLTILTYIVLEHAQSSRHIVLLGVVNRRGRYNCTICSAHGECLAERRQFLPLSTTLSHLLTTMMPETSKQAIFVLTDEMDKTDHSYMI